MNHSSAGNPVRAASDRHPRAFVFDRVLVGDRWVRDLRMEVDSGGRVAALEPGGPAHGAERVPGWSVPGVPNVHSHAFQRALAGLAEGPGPDSFWSWRRVMYGFLERLAPDDVEAIAAQLYVELLKSGFTCVGEFHYLHHGRGGQRYDDPAEMSLRILRAAKRAGIGLVLFPSVYETGGLGGEPLVDGQRRFRMSLDDAVGFHEALRDDVEAAGAQLGWALHSLRAVSPDSVRRLPEALRAVGEGAGAVHVHVAEQEREVRECLEVRGARPVEWLLDRADVDPHWCLVHATHTTRRERRAIAAAGAAVGLCPTTEANLGDGLFGLGPFVAEGGRWAIGTDSHMSRSPVEELRLLDYGQRLVTRSRSVLRGRGGGVGAGGVGLGAGAALLAHALDGGRRALAWDGGRVRIGARADIVTLDGEHPALVGRGGAAVLDSWIFSGTDNPVRDVMVGGKWVVRAGRHRREEEVKRAFARVMRRLILTVS